ncbi:MAG: cytidylate kinase-like family protein [Eubacteriales bacterium]|nr:cytidylate kinase-like family protein [Eubacteriales bacterium]
MKKYPTITISRQYAAGGRSIAKGLAERLGIPYYDNDFVQKTAEHSGYSVDEIQKEGESISQASKIMNSLLNNAVSYVSSYDEIYKAQKKVILDLSKEDCIIVGRCSNVILKDAGIPGFHIYLYADVDKRVKRAEQLNENEGADLARYIARRDALRNNYYRTYTGHEMGSCVDYNICLDTGVLSYEQCIDLLADLIKNLPQE